jgi:hypothetical protein
LARTRTRTWTRSPATSRARNASACRFDNMNANRFRVSYGERWPQRTRSPSSPLQAVVWFGESDKNPAAPRSTTASRWTAGSGPLASTIFPRTSLPA